MFGDDSRLRLRKTASDAGFTNTLPFAAPSNNHRPSPTAVNASNANSSSTTSTHAGMSINGPVIALPTQLTSGKVKGNRKRRRKNHRQLLGRCVKTCLSGVLAAVVWASLSFMLLPLKWVQVDYHHQVQQAAAHLWQRVEENRHNYATAIRGKHSQNQPKILCVDGTVGFENDDYCDCPDGKDEPNTSACSHLHVQQPMFTCHSDRAHVIFSSRVGDGVHDCADGSDESS